MIQQSTIDSVYQLVRIEEVISDFVQLRRSGSNFKGLSPFTDEKSPSFMVSPVKQIWKDFSSGKGGNVISFLMEHEHFSYPEAIKYLARKYNVTIEETQVSEVDKQVQDARQSLYILNEFANAYFQEQLSDSQEGTAVGYSYFIERGFSKQTIEAFQLGYSPKAKDVFTQHALSKGYSEMYLEQTGLSIIKPDYKADRFRERVIFPIHSMSGRVLGFGGRILTQNKKLAKYINSPQSEVYDKSKVLYGIYFAKQAIAKLDNCYLVEGYTDVIQMHQSGITNVVSSSGTALTPQQILLIQRLTSRITLLFDGDAAGIRAAIRGVDLILEQGMSVKICVFPDGQDPDSFCREFTKTEIETYLEENSTDFIQFKANLLQKEAQKDPVKKASLARDIVQSIAVIPDLIQKEVYIKECASILGLSERVLFDTLALLEQKNAKEHQKQQNNLKSQSHKKGLSVVSQQTQTPQNVSVNASVTLGEEQQEQVCASSLKASQNPQRLLEYKIISVLANYGNQITAFEDMVLQEDEKGDLEMISHAQEYRVYEKIFLDLQQDEIAFSDPMFKKLYMELITRFQNEQSISVNDLPSEFTNVFSDILMEQEKYHLHRWDSKEIYVKSIKEDTTLAKYVMDLILNFRRILIASKIEEIIGSLSKDTGTIDLDIMEEIQDYYTLRTLIANKLSRVVIY